jgi:hypothetical protein
MTIEIILLALSPIFIIFVSFEFIKYRRYYDIKDSLANTVLALMHQGADAVALLVLMPFFLLALYLSVIRHRTYSLECIFCIYITRFFILLVS